MNMGYRQMTWRSICDHRLVVGKETGREVRKQGTELVNAKPRRQYANREPNHLWHMDGYDIFKPFGFCIHERAVPRILCLRGQTSHTFTVVSI